jgi:DICT domain-containing protein
VLESNGRFLATDPLAARREYLKRRHSGVWAGRPSAPPAVVSAMTDTQFESYDKQQMIHASRIVEFRAWNVGEGELHAGFQDLSKIDFQTNVYRNLERKGLDVHVYGAGDEETVAAAEGMGLDVQESDDEEIVRHWWVAFDGDGGDADKSLLLAQERARTSSTGSGPKIRPSSTTPSRDSIRYSRPRCRPDGQSSLDTPAASVSHGFY